MSPRILVVDDNRLTREQLKEILIADGAEIVGEAADGIQAINSFEHLHPDVIFMDLLMPFKDGVEATIEILKTDPSARIIICSILGKEDMLAKALEAGAKDHIGKPVKPEEVTLAVKRVLAAISPPAGEPVSHEP